MTVADSFDLTGQVAVVTGGGTGIGEGIAKSYAAAGAGVVVAGRRPEPIERVAAEITESGGQAIAVRTDVTDRSQLEALADAAVDRFGSLSIWCNNAGGSPHRTPLTDIGQDGWDQCFDLNVTALWQGTVVAADRMEGGSVLNISSGAAHRGVPGSGHYAAAKAAVNSLTKTFALELAPRVRVNCICPGWIETEIMMTAMNFTAEDLPKVARHIPMGKMGEPEDVGRAAVYFASPAAAWVTGQILDISGGPV